MGVNKSIARDTARTTIANIFVQIVAFFVSIVVAALFGATFHTDAYFLALGIPIIFTAALFGALKAVFIPVFMEYKVKFPEEERELLGSLYFSLIVLSIVVFLIMSIFAPLYIPIIARGFNPESKRLAVRLTLELLPLTILTSMVGIFGSVYNAYQRFVLPMITPIVRSLVSIVFIVLTHKYFGVHSLAYGTVLGEFFQVLVLILILRKQHIYLGLRYFIHPAFLKMARLSVPQVLSNVFLEIRAMVDKILIAGIVFGSITSLNYATKLSTIPLELFSTGGFLTVILSYWSKEKAEVGLESVRASLEKTLVVLFFVLGPIISAMFVLSDSVVRLIYERKAFAPEATKNTGILLSILLISVIPVLLGRTLTRVFFVVQDTWTPFFIGASRTILNLVLNIIFRKFWGIAGIALASAVTSLILCVVLFILVKRKIGKIGYNKLIIKFVKILVAMGITSLSIKYLFFMFLRIFVTTQYFGLFLSLALSTLLGGLLYILSLFVLQLDELFLVNNFLSNLGKRLIRR